MCRKSLNLHKCTPQQKGKCGFIKQAFPLMAVLCLPTLAFISCKIDESFQESKMTPV